MSTRFHLNAKGEPGVCTALKSCPFGELTSDHYESAEAARRAYESAMVASREKLATVKAEVDLVDDELEAFDKAYEKTVAAAKKDPSELAKLQQLEQTRRKLVDKLRDKVYDYSIERQHTLASGAISEDEAEKLFFTKTMIRTNKAKRGVLRTKRNFEKPMRVETYRVLISEFTAWSGLPREEAKALLRGYDKNSGLTRDEYITSLFQAHRDTTRDRVYVDLETSSFSPTTGEILEIGLVRVNPQGEVVATIDQRFDLSEKGRQVGTGAEAIHKVSLESIEGKPLFSDPAVQAELAKHLNDKNVILVAHNATFEHEWFIHKVEGYASVRDGDSSALIASGEEPAPIQDTRNLAMFLGHGMTNTKLETFTEANGVPYVDAHSALPDAEMTWKALEAFESKVRGAPQGQRAQFSPKVTGE